MGEDMNLDPVGELMRSVAPTSDIPLLDEKQLKHVEVTARTLSSRRARHRSTVRFGALGLGLVASALAVGHWPLMGIFTSLSDTAHAYVDAPR